LEKKSNLTWMWHGHEFRKAINLKSEERKLKRFGIRSSPFPVSLQSCRWNGQLVQKSCNSYYASLSAGVSINQRIGIPDREARSKNL